MAAWETQDSIKWWEQRSVSSLPTETQSKQTNKTCYSLGWHMISSFKNKKILISIFIAELWHGLSCAITLCRCLSIDSLCEKKTLPSSTSLPLKGLCSFSLFLFVFVIYSSKMHLKQVFSSLFYLQMGSGKILDWSRGSMEVIKLLLSFRSVAESNVKLPDLKSRSRRENSYSLKCLGLGPHGCHGKDVLWTLVGKSLLLPLGSASSLSAWAEKRRWLRWPLLEKTFFGCHPCAPAAQPTPFLICGSMCQRCLLA